jgi:hypothetical protein
MSTHDLHVAICDAAAVDVNVAAVDVVDDAAVVDAEILVLL